MIASEINLENGFKDVIVSEINFENHFKEEPDLEHYEESL